MTGVLLTLLTVLAVIAVRAIQLYFRERDYFGRYISDPRNLAPILEEMHLRVYREQQWEQVEEMRMQCSKALAKMNQLRHDPKETKLRASKPARNMERATTSGEQA